MNGLPLDLTIRGRFTSLPSWCGGHLLHREMPHRLNHFCGGVSIFQRLKLHRTWTHIRRLVASIMLVAFASFVLHSSAMARVTPLHSGSDAAVHDHHAHAGHVHGASATHTHAMAGPHGDANPGASDHKGANGACCGSFCAAAITPFARIVAVSFVETSAALPTFDVDGHGIADEGPRKPPRTPDIA